MLFRSERVVLTTVGTSALLLATLVRALGPTFDPDHTGAHHALAAALGALAFAAWLRGAWPRVRRIRTTLGVVPPPR